MFESRISAGATEKLPCSENLHISSWSYDMHGRSCQEMCGTILWVGEQNDSTTLQSINSMHWWPSFERRRIEIRGRIVTSILSDCSEMLLLGTCWKTWYSMIFCLARVGRPDILWSMNKLARSITKWTKASGKRSSLLISYIHHTCEYKKYWHVGNTAKQYRLGLFQDSDFAGEILRTQNLLRVEHCAFLEVIHLFQSVGCVRNKFQFRTVQQNQKSFLWTQDWGWTVYPYLI